MIRPPLNIADTYHPCLDTWGWRQPWHAAAILRADLRIVISHGRATSGHLIATTKATASAGRATVGRAKVRAKVKGQVEAEGWGLRIAAL